MALLLWMTGDTAPRWVGVVPSGLTSLVPDIERENRKRCATAPNPADCCRRDAIATARTRN